MSGIRIALTVDFWRRSRQRLQARPINQKNLQRGDVWYISAMKKKVPLTLLTGFLGAGKTTLLNRILTENNGEKIVVIVNEFGDIGIDDKLIKSNVNGAVELTNGCLCCSVKNDTLETMVKLFDDRKDVQGYDRVLIETTGIANPIPFVKAFLSQPKLKEYYRLDGVITVVDVAHITVQLETMKEAYDQIAIANVVLLNKTDLASSEQITEVEHTLRAINPGARIVKTERSLIDVSAVLDIDAFNMDSFQLEASQEHAHGAPGAEVRSMVLREERPLDLDKVGLWIGEALMLNYKDLLRYKGILNIAGRDERIVFQGVHMHFENSTGEPWGDERRKSEVVIIGRNLDEEYFRRTFAACVP